MKPKFNKLMIVPYGNYDSSLKTFINRLDEQMNVILEKKIPVDEKIKLYNNVLLQFKNNFDSDEVTGSNNVKIEKLADSLSDKIKNINVKLENIDTEIKKENEDLKQEIFSFGKNKSRYLIPLNLKVAFIPNEERSDNCFIAKLGLETFNIGLSQLTQTCCVLVNQNFIIQNFTANTVSMLGLNSTSINNGSMDILKFIKEFQDELVKIDFDDRSPYQVLQIKRNIVANKFKNISPVTWRQYDNVKNKSCNMSENISNSISL